MSFPTATTETTFPGLSPGEDVQFYFRKHWLKLVWPAMKTLFFSAIILVFGLVGFGSLTITDTTMRITLLTALSAAFLFVQFQFLITLYCYFLNIVIVTNRRVHRMKKTLLTFNDHQSVDIKVVQDISKVQHGIVQNILGFGSLILEVQDTELRFHYVPDISNQYHAIVQLREHLFEMDRTQQYQSQEHLEEHSPVPEARQTVML